MVYLIYRQCGLYEQQLYAFSGFNFKNAPRKKVGSLFWRVFRIKSNRSSAVARFNFIYCHGSTLHFIGSKLIFSVT